ncbi:ABC transporter ATP-binding protein [Nonomuraea africana]|uniref:ABC-type multidrug transport system ATPase subunit n=1 Tax=Nonomuraea africana TaxID=46171 RepID=A0ABR9KWK3_9ACTN|nr:ABC transporter ATP-binding protein [Nonomuraea africana]MBE1566421.1 ABC-type multidrug transport system ATPase subunit [Nonomuraea africana]
MRLVNVSYSYRKRAPAVLRDVAMTLAPGDVAEVVGANGAGKSTLLRLLAGLTRPTTGTISGRPAVVGFAPDRFPAEQPFTVAAYLAHQARIRRAAVEPWIDRLGIAHLMPERLRDLSKGSAHKVGLAQALMAEPGLLVLDEPFAGLDADARAELPAIVTEIAGRGGMVVVSDHQGGLRGLPSVRRWTVLDGEVKESTASTLPVTAAPTAVVAVTVPADEVPAFVARMRTDGYLAGELDRT